MCQCRMSAPAFLDSCTPRQEQAGSEGWRHGGSAFRIIIIDRLIDRPSLIDPLGCNRGNGAMG